MSAGSFRHLMIYVSDFQSSKAFYQEILGFLNYELAHGSDSYSVWNPTQGGCSFGIVQSDSDLAKTPFQRGTPGFHHLAFNADNRGQIDDFYQLLLRINATVLDPPVACTEYSPTYYAVYFEDPDGMKLEVACS
jgi:glyoxylase I family protein